MKLYSVNARKNLELRRNVSNCWAFKKRVTQHSMIGERFFFEIVLEKNIYINKILIVIFKKKLQNLDGKVSAKIFLPLSVLC